MAKGKSKNFTKRVRGFSVSALGFGGGVTFVQPPEEREIILKLFAQLAVSYSIIVAASCTKI